MEETLTALREGLRRVQTAADRLGIDFERAEEVAIAAAKAGLARVVHRHPNQPWRAARR
jgi:hypothetical protein